MLDHSPKQCHALKGISKSERFVENSGIALYCLDDRMLHAIPTTYSRNIVENGSTNHGQSSGLCSNSGEEEVIRTVENVPETNETSTVSKKQSKEK